VFAKHLRCLLLCASFCVAMTAAASGSVMSSMSVHREAVDESRYPWSAIGKLYNETGSWCSGVAIAADKILTAAHCVFNFRSQRFVPADALHFLMGYHNGRYAVHARVSSYEIGTGFDPLHYNETSGADWAILTVTENLPTDIAPLRLAHDVEPSGTKAVIAGYPQDRAFAMTADSDCELREEVDGGRLLLHTCRGVGGYSGAPILISAGGDEYQIAGIQIAKFNSGGTDRMLAVTAQSIGYLGESAGRGVAAKSERADVVVAANCPLPAGSGGLAALRLWDTRPQSEPDMPDTSSAIVAVVETEKPPLFYLAPAYGPARSPLFPSPMYPTDLAFAVAPDDFAARAQYARIGSWSMAGLALVDRIPPLLWR
jgi:protease YdgD